jgi:hypothetical protein
VDLASSALSWLSLACAVGALAVYAVMVSRQPRMVRLFNGLGLFLTGLALFQGPAILRETGPGTNVFLAILLLNLAVIAQAYAVLRNRTAWDGVDRRNTPGGANT